MTQRPRTKSLSLTTQANWWLDFGLFVSALVALASGCYFLYFVSGGYQGGRNPTYGVTFLFSRQTWDLIHTWSGVAMIAAVAVHLAIHLRWIGMMARKVASVLRRRSVLSKGAKVNVLVDLAVAISFLLTAVSGVYFLFDTRSGWQVAASGGQFLFSRTTWDLIHTWSAVALVSAVVVHLAIHWGWIAKVTAKQWRRLPGRRSTAIPSQA